MDTFRQDVRYACRALMNRPGFSLLAVLTLAVGLGVNAVAFSAINALLYKPMRFEGAEQLGRVRLTGTGNPYAQTSLPDFEDLARETTSFDAMFAEARMPLSLRLARPDGSVEDAAAEEAWGLLVSANYLPAMRARPVVGRLFEPSDFIGSELPAIVSERFWRDRLGGGFSVAGRTVILNGQSFSIIGVLPEGFQGPGGLYEPQLWVPLERLDALALSPRLKDRQTNWLSVLARMRSGVTPEQAQTDLRRVVAHLESVYPATHRGRHIELVPFSRGVAELDTLARVSWIALGVVGTILLIACFNVAGLLLARAAERQREMGVRAALGASRGRVLRQLITEGLLLAGVSALAAVALAAWSADLLVAFSLPSPIPQRLHIALDRRVMLFIAGMSVLAGVLPAVAPAVQAMRVDLLSTLRRESAIGGRPSRLRSLFVIAQVAGSTLFLAAALLFVRSFVNSTRFEPGFDTEHTLVLELNTSAYGYDVARADAFYAQLVDRLDALPGVREVALADRAPYSVGFPKVLDIAASEENCATTTCRTAIEFGISAGHFGALGVPLRAGRDLSAQEVRADAAVAVVGEAMARALWPAQNAVGRSLRTGKDGRTVQVVGVAADTKQQSFTEQVRWYLYRPLRTAELNERVAVIVRTSGDPALLTGAVRQQVGAIDASLPAASIKTTQERMQLPMWPARTAAGVFAICGALALGLATVGLFGVTYFTVSQRTREFGIRVALGATRQRVMSLVLREGLILTLPGVLLGLVGALLGMRVAARLLLGIGPADPATYLATAVLQTVVALAACAFPAYRATNADPMTALRQD